MEMRFPSVPILKSSLQVILFCWKLPTVTFLCLFVLHERAHSLSPSQVCRFPLLLLNVSYSNGMFSLAWSPMPWDGHTDPKLQDTLATPNQSCRKQELCTKSHLPRPGLGHESDPGGSDPSKICMDPQGALNWPLCVLLKMAAG